jgi:6-phosphogluconolactonase (cycloisomerase 2 family)
MKKTRQLSFCLIATISAGTGLAQTATVQSSKSSSPIAYVYVSRPTHVDGFAASSNGKLTPVPGSPFSNIALSHMSVTKKFLFGASDDGADIYSYSIASDGALKEVSVINTHNYPPEGNECYGVGPTQVDFTGSTLYNDDYNCDGDSSFIQAYKIESNGSLQFLAKHGCGR